MARRKGMGSGERSVKIKANSNLTAPDRTHGKAYLPSKKKTMGTKAASSSYTTLLGFTNGGRGSYSGGK